MRNKVILFVLGTIVLFTLAFWYKPFSRPTTTEKKRVQAKHITVTQTIQEAAETVTVEAGQTALDLIQKTAEVKVKGEGKNAFVTAINNVEAQEAKKQFWAFYVNGKPAEVGAGSYVLKNGDIIEWKLETY